MTRVLIESSAFLELVPRRMKNKIKEVAAVSIAVEDRLRVKRKSIPMPRINTPTFFLANNKGAKDEAIKAPADEGSEYVLAKRLSDKAVIV